MNTKTKIINLRYAVMILAAVLLVFAFSGKTHAMKGDYSMPSSLKVKYKTYLAAEQAAQTMTYEIKETRVNSETTKIDDFIYNPKVKMPYEHQKYLFEMTKKRGLDYIKTLAVLKHESQYNQNVIAVNDYGYMQVNLQNHLWLSRKLMTPNRPLDPYININWGTYMLSDFYRHWAMRGISHAKTDPSPFSKLDRYAMSSYNKGVTGFMTYGEATSYLDKVEREYWHLKNIFENL